MEHEINLSLWLSSIGDVLVQGVIFNVIYIHGILQCSAVVESVRPFGIRVIKKR